MEQYPVRTKIYPSWSKDLKRDYSHSPREDRQELFPPESAWTNSCWTDLYEPPCPRKHKSLKEAYNCKMNQDHADHIMTNCRREQDPDNWSRKVLQDELVINGLIPPTQKSHALLVNLQLRPHPELDKMLKKKHTWTHRDTPLTLVSQELYKCATRAIRALYLYGTRPPKGYSKNDLVVLLPLEQYDPFRETVDELVEDASELVLVHNRSQQLKHSRDLLTTVLSYSMEPHTQPRDKPRTRQHGAGQ